MYEQPENNNIEDDTQPTGTFPAVSPSETNNRSGRRTLAVIIVIAMFGFVMAAAALIASYSSPDESNTIIDDVALQLTNTTEAVAELGLVETLTEPTTEAAEPTAETVETGTEGTAQTIDQSTAQTESDQTASEQSASEQSASDQSASEQTQPEQAQPEPTNAPQNDTSGAPSVETFLLPTLSPDSAASLLSQPIDNLNPETPGQVSRNLLDPFTLIPDRPRNQVIDYVIERGDTVYDIAKRFGLEQESIAWSNDRRSLWTLTPGSILKIPPTDGAVHVAVGESTIADIADLYQVDDPLVIIDSEYNALRNVGPDFVPPSGMEIFIPGGIAEEVDWSPPALETGGSGAGPGGNPNQISFESGAPGSCGLQERGVAGAQWVRPIGSYTLTRGFSSFHQGIDLAASPGTPVYSANAGRVIFAGRSNWGYGLAVVVSHGPYTTLYGHLSVVNVSCGQVVGGGQLVGGVGSTGNSSGPHLHFEILDGYFRTNPAATIGF